MKIIKMMRTFCLQATSSLNGDAAHELNGDATPFVPSESGDNANQTYGTFKLKVPLDSKVWKSISISHNHRILAPKKSTIQHAKQSNPFSDMQFVTEINRSLMTDISPEGLISIRRKDNILYVY